MNGVMGFVSSFELYGALRAVGLSAVRAGIYLALGKPRRTRHSGIAKPL